jgi:TIR domain.
MFGKAEKKERSYVVTDEDLLDFSRSWLRSNDSSCKAKPSMISTHLAQRYLLVVGHDYQDWLFRFFWYAMKNENFNREMNGMLALKQNDSALIDFLSRCKSFTRIEPDREVFVNKLIEGIENYEKVNNIQRDIIPEKGTDIFISYSRGDNEIVDILYKVFTAKGLHVWYDHESLQKGLDFMKQIENAIKHSTFFVPVFTPTILDQAHEEHPYRKEWRYAVDHIQNIGGISYCFPFFERGFNMDDMRADIPNDLKKHDAFSFNRNTLAQDAEKMADYLIKEIEQRKRHGRR